MRMFCVKAISGVLTLGSAYSIESIDKGMSMFFMTVVADDKKLHQISEEYLSIEQLPTGKQVLTGGIDASNIKRCYTGIQVYRPCPDCGKEMIRDFADSYLSYPEVGYEEDAGIWCNECGWEGQLPIKITAVDLTMEVGEVKQAV